MGQIFWISKCFGVLGFFFNGAVMSSGSCFVCCLKTNSHGIYSYEAVNDFHSQWFKTQKKGSGSPWFHLVLEAYGILMREIGRMEVLWLQCGAKGWIPPPKARMSTLLPGTFLAFDNVNQHTSAGNSGVEPLQEVTTKLELDNCCPGNMQ